MAKTIFAGNSNSQYDSDLIIKEVHDFRGQSLRTLDTRSLVDQYYTHLRAQYDSENKPVIVSYYQGTKSAVTKFNTVTAGPSLSGKYFTLYSAPDAQKYVVWFNVDGASTQPVVANAVYIEVDVGTGDSPQIVALALNLVLSLYSEQFLITVNGANVEIKTAGLGETTASNVGTSPFTITFQNGEQDKVSEVVIPYLGIDPIYQGQVLKGYTYDIYSGKFIQKIDVNVDNINVDIDSLTSSVTIGDEAGNKATVTNSALNVNTDIDLTTLEQELQDVNTKLDSINTDTSSIDTKLSTTNTELSDINSKLSISNTELGNIDSGIQDLISSSNNIEQSLTDIDSKIATTNTELSNLNTKVTTSNAELSAINTKLVTTNSELVDINQNIDTTNSNLTDINEKLTAPLLTAGTIDGTISGTKYGIVYNLKQQILDSHDRVSQFVYADFGTKNQRVTQIDYSSATFPGVLIRRVFNYTLIGNNYRRDDEVWTVV